LLQVGSFLRSVADFSPGESRDPAILDISSGKSAVLHACGFPVSYRREFGPETSRTLCSGDDEELQTWKDDHVTDLVVQSAHPNTPRCAAVRAVMM
jgi:hypothetical protein